jgi:isoleucyl-tRNA synthetase
MYLEGSDQYRGWFNSSITTSVAINGVAPYKTVLSQGFVLDGEGRKMSKSLGNTVLPEKVVKNMGADIVRLWVSSVDYESDVRISDDILKQVSETYRKIRNTMRFLIGNTEDFQPKEHTVAYEELRSVDQYMMARLDQVVETCVTAYKEYEFSTIYQTIMNFCTVDLSAFYLDFAKDVVYIEKEDNQERRAMQTVFYEVLVKLAKLLTPIIPHTTEEIWSFLKEEEQYAQLAELPESSVREDQAEILGQWEKFLDIRDAALKALEVARNEKTIGKSFEAHLSLFVDEDTKALFSSLDANLEQLFIVSQLDIKELAAAPAEAMQFDNLAILVEHAHGETCERCRAIKAEVGTIADATSLCERCADIVRSEYPEALVPEEA